MSRRSLCRYGPYSPPTDGPSSQSSTSKRSESSNMPYDSSESRAASVSSIRNTNRPLRCRAYAQLNRAVRISPTCGTPVGDGQKRTRTGLVKVHHRVGQGADAFDAHFDGVAGGDRLDPGGGAGEDHVAGQQRHHMGDVRDQGRYVEDHVLGTAELAYLLVDLAAHLEVGRVQLRLDPRADRAERVEALRAGPLRVGALQVAGGHVVGAGVTEHRGHRLVAADPAGALHSDHHGQ